MKPRFLLLGVLLLVGLVAACSPTPVLRNPKFLKDTSLININAECDAPCWRGITPGVTNYNDALIILQDETDLDDPQSQPIPDAEPAIGASWQPTGGEPCCQIVSEDGQTVSSTFLQLAPDITLKQVIDVRGEPEYVLGTTGTEDQAIINLFYPEQNMIVFAFVEGAANGVLSETSEIVGVYYTTTDRMELGINLSSLYGWKGYQPFSAYAPENPDAPGSVTPDYKVTQSVTLTPTGEGGEPAPTAALTATPEGAEATADISAAETTPDATTEATAESSS
ncbi:MAG: hypothetical protein LCI00_04625 [Chloroflexi bacterium]|nr:hypothetical protein [Chloroflexota bacterium]MCC6892006.1 hypothetical protein [Anaerolineae bacterium]